MTQGWLIHYARSFHSFASLIHFIHSLHSLAGVLYGGVWEISLGKNIITTTQLHQDKKYSSWQFHNIIITLYFRLPQKWWRSIDEMISNVTFADWDGWEGTTHPLSFINFNIPPILSFSFK